MKKGRLFILNYDIHEVNPSEIPDIVQPLEATISSNDTLLVLPQTLQLTEVSTEALQNLQRYITTILSSREDSKLS